MSGTGSQRLSNTYYNRRHMLPHYHAPKTSSCRLKLKNQGFISVLIDGDHFRLLFRTLKFNLLKNGGIYKLFSSLDLLWKV